MNSKDRDHAIHESGHAVFAWHGGALLHVATIIGPLHENITEDRQTPYYCEARYPAILASDNGRVNAESVVLKTNVALAPYVVEEKITGKKLSNGSSDILDVIDSLTWNYQNSEVNNLVKSARCAIKENPGNRTGCAKQFYEAVNGPVKQCLDDPRIMQAIEKLADLLLNRGRLTGFEAASFLESVWPGRLPEKAKPADQHSSGLTSSSPGDAIIAAARLLRMAHAILNGVYPKNDEEENKLERAIRAILGSIFQIEEIK